MEIGELIEHPEQYSVRVEMPKNARDLILKYSHPLDESVLDPIRLGLLEGKSIRFTCSLPEFRALVQQVEQSAWYAYPPSVRKRFERVHRNLEEYLGEIEADIRRSVASGREERKRAFHEEIRQRLDGMGDVSLEAMNREIQRLQDEHNRRPMADCGGLSPEQLVRLLYGHDWENPDNAMSVNPALGAEDVGNPRMLANARMFLDTLLAEGGTPVTVAGNVNRKFVKKLVERFQWRPGYDIDLRLEMMNVYNEQDFWHVHVLRVLLELAGFIRKHKKRFVVTKRGKEALRPENVGLFLAHLFITYFREMNLDYSRDAIFEIGEVQQCLPYTLFRTAVLADDWVLDERLAAETLLPVVKGAVAAKDSDFLGLHEAALRIFLPLRDFGLVETRGKYEFRRKDDEPAFIRKTPLFDKMLKFNV